MHSNQCDHMKFLTRILSKNGCICNQFQPRFNTHVDVLLVETPNFVSNETAYFQKLDNSLITLLLLNDTHLLHVKHIKKLQRRAKSVCIQTIDSRIKSAAN